MEDAGKSPYVRFNGGENEAPSAKPIQGAIIITDVTGFEEPETRGLETWSMSIRVRRAEKGEIPLKEWGAGCLAKEPPSQTGAQSASR